ncbi:hypothetical protein TNCV_2160131 [Trichonephila clavipes]|nr:hypothetical protein TNCV_2160131 [Trichonephila clavipes]
MDEDRPDHWKILQWPTNWHTEKSRSILTWIDGLEKYILVLRTKNWRRLVGRKMARKRLLEKAKAHLGCRATEEGRT